jgi:transposase
LKLEAEMAYRELFVLEIKEVLRLWSRGRGFRTVAKRTSVDRKTVRRYVETAEALGLSRDEDSRPLDDDLIAEVAAAVRPGAPSDPGQMREHCREHAELIEGWVDQGCRGPKVRKLIGRHTGVVVPLRTLQRFIAEELGRNGRPRDTVRVVDPAACEILEVDFLELGTFPERGTGRTRKMHALLCTAGYSRHQFVWPCLSQTQQDVIEALEAAWRFFGGVFPLLVFDNLKAVVEVSDPISPKLNPTFVEYVQSRDFEVDPARKRKPRDKAVVERQVQYVRGDYFGGEDFGSVEEARREAVRWCREDAGMRTHGTTRRHPLEVFEQEEQPLLKPAPTEPYDEPCWSEVHAGRDHAVVVNYALYSVPSTIGEVDLRVRSDRATVKLYLGAKLVKVHPRKRPGEASIDPADLPPGKAELATRDGAALQRRAEIFGANVGEYARRLLEGPLPWTRMRQVYRLNGLALRYGELADEACARALELDVVDVMRIQRMLERGLVQRGLLSLRTPQPQLPRKVVPLRFARDPKEYRTRRSTAPQGDPDATA